MSELIKPHIYRGEIWHLRGDTFGPDAGDDVLETIPGGALMVDGSGNVAALGPAAEVIDRFPGVAVTDFGDALILPGFIDIHLHYPQLDIIGCHGERLLQWLERYTFPAEAAFSDDAVALDTAERLVTELAANGTTTGMIFSSSHKSSTEILFAELERRGFRAVVGKVAMDRNAPEAILQSPERDSEDAEELIGRWHGRDGRLFYALTPRFAPTCSEAMLACQRDLKKAHPEVWLQTHWAESDMEIAWVAELFPNDAGYLDVYDRFELLGPRTVLAHGIHVSDRDLARLAETDTVVAHCPTSNLFLGSGLCPVTDLTGAGVRVAMGTDIGGGTSCSMWQTMNEAYKVAQLRGGSISPVQLFDLCTLRAAEAIGMGDRIGNFEDGKAADFQVVDWTRSRLLRPRFQTGATPAERLFALIMLADDRLTRATYVGGRRIYGLD